MNSKRIISLLLCVLFASVGTINAATCCIWRVAGAKAPCYLVGTVHSLSGSDFPISPDYNRVYDESKRLVFEIYFDPQGDYNRKFDKAAAYPNGDGVQRHVHPKTWQIITANFGNASIFGKPGWLGDTYLSSGIQQMRPWAIAYYFFGIPGYSDEHLRLGVDNDWMRRGLHSDKELVGLENDQEHIDVLAGMNDIESELILLEAIAFRNKMRPELDQLKAAWKRGDTATIWALDQRFRKLDPGADARLIDLRNVKWVPKIRREFESGKPTAIVVGCGHMLGPNGLIALLERNGYHFDQL
ncbi:MAG TPA: TraB/GumN family protein [Chthoniobacterales bacterium]|nr:TraB/GumN family protein [Chthoniobacterales bacterium]